MQPWLLESFLFLTLKFLGNWNPQYLNMNLVYFKLVVPTRMFSVVNIPSAGRETRYLFLFARFICRNRRIEFFHQFVGTDCHNRFLVRIPDAHVYLKGFFHKDKFIQEIQNDG